MNVSLIITNQVIYKQLNHLAELNLLKKHQRVTNLFFTGTFYRYGLIKTKHGYRPAMLLRNVKISSKQNSDFSANFKTFWLYLYPNLAKLGKLQNRLKLQFVGTIKTNYSKYHHAYYYFMQYVSKVSLARRHKLPILPLDSSALCGAILFNDLDLSNKLQDFQSFKLMSKYTKWLCNYILKFSKQSYLKHLAKNLVVYTPYSAIYDRLDSAKQDLNLCIKTTYINNSLTKTLIGIIILNACEFIISAKQFIQDETSNNGHFLDLAVSDIKQDNYKGSVMCIDKASHKLQNQNFSSGKIQKRIHKYLADIEQGLSNYIQAHHSENSTNFNILINQDLNNSSANLISCFDVHQTLLKILNLQSTNLIYTYRIHNVITLLKHLSSPENNLKQDNRLLNTIKLLSKNLEIVPNQLLFHNQSVTQQKLNTLIKNKLD